MLGKAEDSLVPLEEAINYAQKNKDPYLESWVEQALTESYSALGYLQKAQVHLLRSLYIAFETNNTPLVLDNLLMLAQMLFDKHFDLAIELLAYVANHSQVLEISKRQAQSLLEEQTISPKLLIEKDLNYVINYVSKHVSVNLAYST